MALRAQILAHAIPQIPTYSFTRSALLTSLRSIRPEVSDPDAVIDTMFGDGTVGATKALVEQWENEGKVKMSVDGGNSDAVVGQGGHQDLGDLLRRRIEWSAGVGEHLVEAYANLATPTSTPSIPLPSLPIIRRLLSSMQLPATPRYSPPLSASSSSSSSSSSSASVLDRFLSSTGGRIPLLSTNPLGPLGYAWRIADEALYLTEQQGKKVGTVKRGYWNEPVGPGPEWYTKRVGLTAVYLSAESHLLQPYPLPSTSTATTKTTADPRTSAQIPNPHSLSALSALNRNLSKYQHTISSLERGEENLGDLAGFVDYVAKSWGGLIRSRYL